MTGDTTPISDEAVEAGAQAAFFTDDLGGHHKIGYQPHTWDNIPEEGRKNYRDMVRSVLVAARPLLVSADSTQAERINAERREREALIGRLRAELAAAHDNAADEIRREARWQESLRVRGNSGPSWQQSIDRLLAVEQIVRSRAAVLRAAGGQEKPVCPLTEAGIEHRPHHYLTPVPWDCPGLPAAPVGGQHSSVAEAEPSDAAKHTIAWTLDANRGCIEGRITCHADPGDPCHRACRCEDASCYCGGATMEDIDFCNPLAFIENEDDVSLIERYDGADETLRDGPVELVWMPDGETYGWRYAAAAVSGEHQDATEDAQ